MKKILVKAYMNLNFGDDLFLKILFDRYTNVNWILESRKKIYKKIYKNYTNVNVYSFLPRVKKKLKIQEGYSIINRYDALVFIGGSIFMQDERWRNSLEYRNQLVETFTNNNKPFFVIGSNFGPYTDEKFLKGYKSLLSKAEDVCFREIYSYNKFKEYKNIRVEPDIVFQLKQEKIDKKQRSIGISMIELENRVDLKLYKKVYLTKIKEIVENGIEKGFNFTFFSFCEPQGDLKIINEVINLIDKKYTKQIKIVNYDGNIESFLLKFQSMESIIGTRFHACILSQIFSQGLYPIIYSDKTYNVLKDIKLDKEYMYIKDLDKLDVNHLLNVILNNKLEDTNIFKKAEKQFKGLDNYIEKNNLI